MQEGEDKTRQICSSERGEERSQRGGGGGESAQDSAAEGVCQVFAILSAGI